MTLDDRSTSDRAQPDGGTMSLRQAARLVHEFIQNGQGARAEVICRKALAAVPDDLAFTHSLGVALAMQGRIGDGVALLRKVAKVVPENIEVLHNLGTMLLNAGDFNQAIETFNGLLLKRPNSPQALCNMGKALWELGKKDEAEDVCRKSLEIAPDMPEAHLVLGKFAHFKKEYGKAIPFLERAAELWPGNADVHFTMALTFMAQDRIDEAIAAWRKTVELRPDCVEDRANLGNALLKRVKCSCSSDQSFSANDYLEAINEAAHAFRRCLAVNPQFAAGHRGLGAVAWMSGSYEEVLAHYDRALAIEPEHVESHLVRAMALFRMGNYVQGWEEYEWRWKRPEVEYRRPDYPQPLWDGSDLGGRRILLHSEQGHGDMIQFARYVSMVADRGGYVILQCAPELERLFRPIRGVGEISSCNKSLLQFDVYYPLMSLPLIFKTTLESIPSQVPYLCAEPTDIEVWRRRVGEKTSFRVGIVWSGSRKNYGDRRRSCSLRLLAPLLAVPGVSFFSLQVGSRPEDVSQLSDMGIVDVSPHLTDFAQTAAALTQLDLVISVDTAVVHLAGAMGRPVWVMLAFESDWRWLENRADSPWYPTVRLFRQDRPGNWQGLIQDVEQALRAEVGKFAGI